MSKPKNKIHSSPYYVEISEILKKNRKCIDITLD